MAMDPEELVTLTDHGTMKLRSAVARAMMLPAKERKRATIVRRRRTSDPEFHARSRNLAAQWDENGSYRSNSKSPNCQALTSGFRAAASCLGPSLAVLIVRWAGRDQQMRTLSDHGPHAHAWLAARVDRIKQGMNSPPGTVRDERQVAARNEIPAK